MSDSDLLQRYLQGGAPDAFSALVHRHLDLVYSVARRHVPSASTAQEVAQSVFIELARHARHIKAGTPLVAWLHVVARRTAINAVRDATRRQTREQIAAEIAAMKSPSSEWSGIEPLLDEAVESLPETDRAAILLRFFENKSLREVGASLGTSDDAAQKRITRAVESLRTFFVRRGVAVTATGLAADISAHAIEVGPTGLAATITTNAFAPAVAVASAGLGKSLLMMNASKTLATTGVTVALIFAGIQWWRPPTPDQPSIASVPLAVLTEPSPTTATAAALAPSPSSSPSTSVTAAGGIAVAAEAPVKTVVDRMEDPVYRAKLQAQAKVQLDNFYGPLFKRLALTPEQEDGFKNLLVEKQVIRTDAARAGSKIGIVSGDDLYTSGVVQMQRDTNDRIRSLLGTEAAFEDYAVYEMHFNKRMVINRLAAMVQESDPLTEIQVEQLVKTWVETAAASTAHTDLMGMNLVTGSGNDHPPFGLPGLAILRKSQPLLSAEQYKAFQTLRAELMLEKAEKQLRQP